LNILGSANSYMVSKQSHHKIQIDDITYDVSITLNDTNIIFNATNQTTNDQYCCIQTIGEIKKLTFGTEPEKFYEIAAYALKNTNSLISTLASDETLVFEFDLFPLFGYLKRVTITLMLTMDSYKKQYDINETIKQLTVRIAKLEEQQSASCKGFLNLINTINKLTDVINVLEQRKYCDGCMILKKQI